MTKKSVLSIAGNQTLQHFILCFHLIVIIMIAWQLHHKPIGSEATIFMVLFAVLACVFTRLERKNYSVFFLLSTFCFLTSWRLAALAGYFGVCIAYLGMLVVILGQFLYTVWHDVYAPHKKNSVHLNLFEWQLIFIRMYMGYDLIPHCCEKLFAGPLVRSGDIAYFTHVHAPSPFWFVLLAGCIEFAGGLAISCGFMTRTAGFALCVYFLVASAMGGHFYNGFIWANANGGWEYPALCAVLFLSFATKGADLFSIDSNLQQRFQLPKWLVNLMGSYKSV